MVDDDIDRYRVSDSHQLDSEGGKGKRKVCFLHAIWFQQKQNQDQPTAVWSSQILCWTWLQTLKFGEREGERGRREVRQFWWPTFFFYSFSSVLNSCPRCRSYKCFNIKKHIDVTNMFCTMKQKKLYKNWLDFDLIIL